ncbi:unnamed protein product [Nyctereutes procyonoides]|uniref:(raccoon dog) hypothetical protein n=1 Tax=Nyctereutes procyonoides TaxID=34880 RepID=A0A811ZBF9_NYCPR|nr:unnamed protein product [Nyctereutes procyonoides]
MSRALDTLQMKEEDVLKFLAAGTHLGGTNIDFQMEQYIYKRKSLHHKSEERGSLGGSAKGTWEKLLLAADAVVAISSAHFTAASRATRIVVSFFPGNFTNQIQAAFWELRLLVVTIPRADHQLLQRHLMGAHSVSLVWWMMAWEVLRMHGTISYPEEIGEEDQATTEMAMTKEEFQGEWTAPAPEFTQLKVADWSEGMQVLSVPIQYIQSATEAWSVAPTAQATVNG